VSWREELSHALPPPQDDEGRSLRQDIIDELADHLHCALARELRQTGDVAEARRRVLARFGDPAKLARQLWWQRMKGRIMIQRLTIIVTCVVAVACLAACLLMWRALEQTRATSRAMMATLKELSAKVAASQQAPSPYGDWVPFKVQLVLDDGKGSPAVGFDVDLRQKKTPRGASYGETQRSDESGVCDFGFQRWGPYRLRVRTPWGEVTGYDLFLRPKQREGAYVEKIVCPTEPTEADVKLEAQWPEGAEAKQYWILCDFLRKPREVAGRSWEFLSDRHTFWISPDGTAFMLSGASLYEIYVKQRGGGSYLNFAGRKLAILKRYPGTVLSYPARRTSDAIDHINIYENRWPVMPSVTLSPARLKTGTKLPVGEYFLQNLLIAIPAKSDIRARVYEPWRPFCAFWLAANAAFLKHLPRRFTVAAEHENRWKLPLEKAAHLIQVDRVLAKLPVKDWMQGLSFRGRRLKVTESQIRWAASLFLHADTDQDGKLSAAEFDDFSRLAGGGSSLLRKVMPGAAGRAEEPNRRPWSAEEFIKAVLFVSDYHLLRLAPPP